MASSKFIKYFIADSAGNAALGMSVWIVPQEITNPTFPTDYLPLTAHASRAGMYYRNNVPHGEYKIYIDPAGGSVPALYDENIFHGEKEISDIVKAMVTDVTTYNASITKHGLLPKLPNDETKFMNGKGMWATPEGGGGGGSVQATSPFTFPLKSTINSGNTSLMLTEYNHVGILAVNPINGVMRYIFRKGTAHINNNSAIKVIKSSNGGFSWSAEQTLFVEADFDLRNVAGGYTKNGRLVIFYGKYYQAATWQSIVSRYSDDDGITWSDEIAIDVQSNSIFSPYGHIVEDESGNLYQPWYGINGSTYSTYILKSTDNGETWGTNYTVISSAEKCTEASIVYLGGGSFLLISRIENGNNFRQFVSSNYCQTWTNQGLTSFETWTPADSGDVPMPSLNYINYHGIGIIALYYTLRSVSPQKLKVVFGLASVLSAEGTLGWNIQTIKEVYTYQTNPTRRPGYQKFFHPENSFRGIGITTEETSTSVAYPVVVYTPTNDIDNLLTILGGGTIPSSVGSGFDAGAISAIDQYFGNFTALDITFPADLPGSNYAYTYRLIIKRLYSATAGSAVLYLRPYLDGVLATNKVSYDGRAHQGASTEEYNSSWTSQIRIAGAGIAYDKDTYAGGGVAAIIDINPGTLGKVFVNSCYMKTSYNTVRYEAFGCIRDNTLGITGVRIYFDNNESFTISAVLYKIPQLTPVPAV